MYRDLIVGTYRVPAREVTLAYSRASGPGGQHVNKTETRVTIRFGVTTSSLPDDVKSRLIKQLGPRLTKTGELLVSCDTFRSRMRNEEEALRRLESMLARALVRRRKRKKTKPTRGSKERRLKEKRIAGERKRMRRAPGRDD